MAKNTSRKTVINTLKTMAARYRKSLVAVACGTLFVAVVYGQPATTTHPSVFPVSPIAAFASATPTTTQEPTLTPTPTMTQIDPTPSATLNACQEVWLNGTRLEQETGYCLLEYHWVPGMVVNRVIWSHMPSPVWGYSAAYAAGIMPDPGPGYVGGVSVPFCIEVGRDVWLKHDGAWEGPFKVMDCSRPVGLYMHVVEYGLVVEVDYDTWQRWGSVGVVTLSFSEPGDGDQPAIFIRDWFLTLNPLGMDP